MLMSFWVANQFTGQETWILGEFSRKKAAQRTLKHSTSENKRDKMMALLKYFYNKILPVNQQLCLI